MAGLGRRWHRGHGQPALVFEHQAEKLAGLPIAREKLCRLAEAAEEPPKPALVSPCGDAHLVSAEETDGGAEAIDGWAVIEIAPQLSAQALLHTAADRHNDMRRAFPADRFHLLEV